MTQPTAERTANVLMGVAAVAAAVYVLRTPALRRRAWGLARTALAASGPWLIAQTRQAWTASGDAAAQPPDVRAQAL